MVDRRKQLQYRAQMSLYRVSERRFHFLDHISGFCGRISMRMSALRPEMVIGYGWGDQICLCHKPTHPECEHTECFTASIG